MSEMASSLPRVSVCPPVSSNDSRPALPRRAASHFIVCSWLMLLWKVGPPSSALPSNALRLRFHPTKHEPCNPSQIELRMPPALRDRTSLH